MRKTQQPQNDNSKMQFLKIVVIFFLLVDSIGQFHLGHCPRSFANATTLFSRALSQHGPITVAMLAQFWSCQKVVWMVVSINEDIFFSLMCQSLNVPEFLT